MQADHLTLRTGTLRHRAGRAPSPGHKCGPRRTLSSLSLLTFVQCHQWGGVWAAAPFSHTKGGGSFFDTLFFPLCPLERQQGTEQKHPWELRQQSM